MNSRFALPVLLTLMLAGCSGKPSVELVEVEGTVTQNGQPLDEVKITFAPDSEKMDNAAQPSHAVTDANGKYRLKYSGSPDTFGAQVGWHRITAIDFKAENSRDDPIPVRIAQKYAIASKTDKAIEVKAGEKMTFDFELDPRK